MAKKYELGFVRKMINNMMTGRIAKGKAQDNMYLLTTLGRKSGLERTTPVTLLNRGGLRYLVAPYGEVGWVHNLRASGLAELSQGGSKEEIGVEELGVEAAAPVLKQYVQEVKVVRSFFDADHDAPESEFVIEAATRPVFQIKV
ncbi:MAG: nitroreductase family deazaflavin-dependent oxidoreductase [bacterium]|nr:nitroreductase family deazaflavin-dependent oxidoreductase [bacterium]